MKTIIRLSIAAAFGTTISFPFTASAFEVKLSGQVNRALMIANNGSDSEVFHVDNDNSGSRIRVKGNHDISEQVKAVEQRWFGLTSPKRIQQSNSETRRTHQAIG